MNIITRGNRLSFEATNDLNYVFKELPGEFEHRQSTLPGSTSVDVSIHADGIYPDLDVDNPNDRAAVSAWLQQLLALTDKELEVTAVRPKENNLSARVMIDLKYPRLDACTSDEILAAVNAKLSAVQQAGFKFREPQPED